MLALCEAAAAQGDPVFEMLRTFDPPDPVLRYTVSGQEMTLQPWDIAMVDLSESGGITDIFIRLAPEAAETLSAMTARAVGTAMTVWICGHVLRESVLTEANVTGTLYLPNTTAVRAEALRALWHGRSTCDTLDSEVIPDDH